MLEAAQITRCFDSTSAPEYLSPRLKTSTPSKGAVFTTQGYVGVLRKLR